MKHPTLTSALLVSGLVLSSPERVAELLTLGRQQAHRLVTRQPTQD